MVSSNAHPSFTLLRHIGGPLRFIRHVLKSFILRCLLLWPNSLRKLSCRDIWSWYFPSSSGETSGLLYKDKLRRWEGYSVVCASKIPERAGELNLRRLISSSSSAGESLPPEHITRPHSMPHNPLPSVSSFPDTPQHTVSPYETAGSGRNTAVSLVFHQSNTPVPWTHHRATSRHSSRAARRPSPFRFRLSSPSTPERIGTDIPLRPGVIHNLKSHSSPDIPAPHTPDIDFRVDPPSRSATLGLDSSITRSSHQPQLSRPFQHSSLPNFRTQLNSEDTQAGSSVSPPRFLFPEPSAFPPPVTPTLNTNRPSTQLGVKYQIRPMHADQLSRYVKKGDVPRKDSAYRLMPLQTNLPHSHYEKYNQDLGGWIPVTHPGGALHFYHEKWNVFTDVYMYDPDLRAEMEQFTEQLSEEFRRHGYSLGTGLYDLVLDRVETKDGKIIWQYYFVDHETRTLFWLNHYDMRNLLREVYGAGEPGHIKIRLEALYWVHWSLYPVGGVPERHFPDDAFKDLLGVLLSSTIDSLTSKVSSSPYSAATMQMIRDVIGNADSLGTPNAHSISSIARLLSIFAQWRFIDFHGQKSSRQGRHKSIYKGDHHQPTKLIKVLSLILFFLPDVHLRGLKKVWMDELIIEEVWKQFMQKLVSEWSILIGYSTVMLATNVAFLAIQGVIIVPSSGRIQPSATQIASSASLVFSIGSIITGLVLIRRNRTMMEEDAKTAWNYLKEMEKPFFHLEPLAIVFSLTYALLMWSVLLFFAALLLFSFQNTTKEIRVVIGAATGFTTVLVIWCIVNSWDSGGRDEEELVDFENEEDASGVGG